MLNSTAFETKMSKYNSAYLFQISLAVSPYQTVLLTKVNACMSKRLSEWVVFGSIGCRQMKNIWLALSGLVFLLTQYILSQVRGEPSSHFPRSSRHVEPQKPKCALNISENAQRGESLLLANLFQDTLMSWRVTSECFDYIICCDGEFDKNAEDFGFCSRSFLDQCKCARECCFEKCFILFVLHTMATLLPLHTIWNMGINLVAFSEGAMPKIQGIVMQSWPFFVDFFNCPGAFFTQQAGQLLFACETALL